MEWSSNSEYILCMNIKRAIVQIYSIRYPQWKCKLIEGSAGLQAVTWSPDSKYIFTIADFNVSIYLSITFACYYKRKRKKLNMLT